VCLRDRRIGREIVTQENRRARPQVLKRFPCNSVKIAGIASQRIPE
jgi:hypothetical protein